jgi:superfamily II DNA or RNA helicase/rubredoxin
MSSSRPGARTQQRPGFVNTIDNISISGSDEEQASTRRSSRRRRQDTEEDGNEADFGLGDSPESEDELVNMAEDDSDAEAPRRRSSCAVKTKTDTRRRSGRKAPASEDDEDEDDLPLKSDVYKGTKRKREPHGMRHSERSTRHTGGMQEIEVDNIYRSSSDETAAPVRPKTTSTREVFQALPRSDDFRMRHNQFCDTCGQGQNAAPLIYCQGCSLSYHKSCLGHRTGREHLVTKISEDNFVLQCRRCVAFPKKKDPVAPDHAKCQDCREPGLSCRPFRRRTTPAQEQKARDENDGVDPATHVDPSRINNADNVLFRCTACFRGFHYEHLPSRSDMLELEMAVDAEQRFREYSRDWKCRDCVEQPAKVSGIIAWKPMDEDAYDPNNGLEAVEEDNKIYLVKWEGMSYFRARWMAGAWVWGVTASGMRKAFAKREDSQHPKMRTEDAIPEDYLRADIVLDIKFTSIVDINTEEVDKARIREVDKALIKYKGLGYEDAVWEAPPAPEDGDRWTDFVTAYNDWVAGRYVKPPKGPALRTRLERARKEDFEKLEKKVQPANLVGGELMKYQVEGVNWLYYKWQQRKNAILADEMGLGKTIQIIGLLATLVQDWTCYPFLVVVPNSTCPNWRREIKRWAPSLRVVAYYGSQQSRDLAHRYELYPEGSRVLRCHIVVTSYDAAADENCRKFFRGVPWQGLIVDEGQRLKNDKNQLYLALEAMKIPFKVLMTGTPLQNNQRELFNLLHFLDETFNAAELETEYEELDPQKLARLHELIRPFFLRRTKAQVLTFLPPMAQIIVPVSMSIVQKTLYKNILAKNPDLLRSIFSQEATAKDVKTAERASLNNILMQLRKCLCHPFVYSNSIEDRNVSVGASHRNLVDASGKLKLLELLLPRLQQLGHRVLIFSQFLSMLDMVEDFLEGLTMRYMRLDGQISSLQKQKRIDAFNAPDSPYFAFLLSTRAGGVGINLATADTVIILDPDFNPHQDIQALARAHRIGQTKKVLCFQLVTRASAEERIMQIGRKKLALEHLLIRSMDTEEEADENELSSVLRHGVAELFEDNGEQDIVFDAFSIDRLLDRSHIEAPPQGEGQSVENQFSFAKVWANDKAALQDAEQDLVEEAPDPGMWVNILKERERIAAEEAAAKAVAFGRGRRARQNVDYAGNVQPEVDLDEAISTNKRGRRRGENDESDTDFQDDESDGDDDVAIVPGEDAVGTGEISELTVQSNPKPSTGLSKPGKADSTITTTPTSITKTAKSLKGPPMRSHTKAKAALGTSFKVAKNKSAAGQIRHPGQGISPIKPPSKPKDVVVGKKRVKAAAPKSTPRADSPFGDLVVIDLGDESDDMNRIAVTEPIPV